MPSFARLTFACGIHPAAFALFCVASPLAEGLQGVTAVSAKVSGDFFRARLPNGSFRAETFAFRKGGRWGPFQTERDDLSADIEESRYFVVLMAYDFQLLRQRRQHRLLWQT